MQSFTRSLVAVGFVCLTLVCVSCGTDITLSKPAAPAISSAATALTTVYSASGDVEPVHDPSLIRQGNTWYSFTSDINGTPTNAFLRIRCSNDLTQWRACGAIFSHIPAWITAKVPGAARLWAPDISYFNGRYHVYYAGSTSGSQQSVIGLATNKTLDASDPDYKWIDCGLVLESQWGDDFNAIDPNILVDSDHRVWLTYGSYWTGIKQREIDPSTGMSSVDSRVYSLAQRPKVSNDPIEGPFLIHHGPYYYLFVSIDYCCNSDFSTDNYKEAVGRSTSPHGPFLDQDGVPMMQGGLTVILQGAADWGAPGGASVYQDPKQGDLLIFHALKMDEDGTTYQWIKTLQWSDDWPTLN
jgi:arabinan endo-1,5-alpha-L-arabinosidase